MPIVTSASCQHCYDMSRELGELRKVVEAMHVDLEQTLAENKRLRGTLPELSELRRWLKKVSHVTAVTDLGRQVNVTAVVADLAASATGLSDAFWHSVANELANAMVDEMKRGARPRTATEIVAGGA